ncbi:MAG TPA: hypothetical protein VFC00_00310 [Micromonosporaceae bacterium]|nr:hypothetical protein [Micromonosporaceae bacterium]
MANRPVWTVERIRALGATTTLPTAAAILGIGRTLAYELVATGQFPTPVIRAGTRVIVPVAPLLKLLHADDDLTGAAGEVDGEPAGRRLDHRGPQRVHATTNHPADSPRRPQVRRIRAHQERDP